MKQQQQSEYYWENIPDYHQSHSQPLISFLSILMSTINMLILNLEMRPNLDVNVYKNVHIVSTKH